MLEGGSTPSAASTDGAKATNACKNEGSVKKGNRTSSTASTDGAKATNACKNVPSVKKVIGHHLLPLPIRT